MLALPGEVTQVSWFLQEVKTHLRRSYEPAPGISKDWNTLTAHFRDGGPRGSRRVTRSQTSASAARLPYAPLARPAKSAGRAQLHFRRARR